MIHDDVVSFVEALEDSETRPGGRNILLGNGFSIAWNSDIFSYGSLYEEADLPNLTTSKSDLFASLETHDFEEVIKYLRSAAKLADTYGADPKLAKRYRRDANIVRRGLSDVIAKRHPANSYDPKDEEVEHARAFLEHFGRIFTLNYDLLLYWVLLRSDGSEYSPQKGDGFEWPTYNNRQTLIWKSSAADRGQRVFYLHGALHYFVGSDSRLHKFSYSSGGTIIDQVRDRIEDGRYPLLVTEGDHKEKVARIERSAYLRYCQQRLNSINGSLFTYGVSFSANDKHIFSTLEEKDNQVEALYVGLYGDPDEEHNEDIIRTARRIKRRRSNNGGRKLSIYFYDAASAHVWRP
jgi:hypothetical protein